MKIVARELYQRPREARGPEKDYRFVYESADGSRVNVSDLTPFDSNGWKQVERHDGAAEILFMMTFHDRWLEKCVRLVESPKEAKEYAAACGLGTFSTERVRVLGADDRPELPASAGPSGLGFNSR